MKSIILFLVLSFWIKQSAVAQEGKIYNSSIQKDTTIVGRILETDSFFLKPNSSRAGIRYYYGIYHLKVEMIDLVDSLIKDTLIIAIVYNMRSEIKNYIRGFDLKVGKNYIFDIGAFSPCEGDFPKLQGFCDEYLNFIPESNKLIKRYNKIYRVIYSTKWDGNVK